MAIHNSNQKTQNKNGRPYDTRSTGNIKGSSENSKPNTEGINGGGRKLGRNSRSTDGKKEGDVQGMNMGKMEKEGDAGAEHLRENGNKEDSTYKEGKTTEVNAPTESENVSHNVNNISFAKVVGMNVEKLNTKLEFIPTVTNEDGREIVIFDEDLVQEGCKKWDKTLCGHFVGFKMPFYEIKYHIMRMWRKFGIEDLFMNNCGVYFFKFGDDKHLEYIVDNGPWMISNRPLIVQKWNPDICIDMTEPSRLPLWIKLWNIPLEAWSLRGMSAIASRVGKPIMMDKGTAMMCNEGKGNAGYARLLVEVDAGKELVESIEIGYQGIDKGTKNTKFVKVEYTWRPLMCCYCKVFGHSWEGCKQNVQVVKTGKTVADGDGT